MRNNIQTEGEEQSRQSTAFAETTLESVFIQDGVRVIDIYIYLPETTKAKTDEITLSTIYKIKCYQQ